MNFNISGYSTALFSTWYFIEELGILFDVGDGVTSSLLQKTRKINNIFISHADRDHLTGLLQLNQLNARDGFPIIHYPKDCGSFPAIETFSKKFDPHVTGTVWKPVIENEIIIINNDISILAIRNNHVESNSDVFKSLSYKVYETKKKLKPEFASLPKQKILELINENGKESLTTEINTNLLTYSGDTPVDDYEKWNYSKILIHEATFLGKSEENKISTHGNKHSYLDDVIKMVAEINIEKLILGHFSSRYSDELIDKEIRQLAKDYKIKIPIYRILPGKTKINILKDEPVNS